MMVLVALESLQIRALHSQSAHSVSLRGAVLEGAETLPAGRHANNVEICMCPANYLGDSCQVTSGRPASRSCFPVLFVDEASVSDMSPPPVCRNALLVSTETPSASSWGSASPVTVTDTRTAAWTEPESVW